jgi:hypothetical protein
MALMDKMKAQAQQLAQKAQEAGKAGQSKLEDVQAKRKWDATLRDLGAAVYAQKTGTATDGDADVERIMKELNELEAQSAADAAADATPAAAPDSGTTPDTETTPEGGFKL